MIKISKRIYKVVRLLNSTTLRKNCGTSLIMSHLLGQSFIRINYLMVISDLIMYSLIILDNTR